MSNRLAQRYARYGLLANLNLSALEHLRETGPTARPSGDDEKRLRRLQELLGASWEGGFINGKITETEPVREQLKRHQLAHPGGKSGHSTRSRLDDARIVDSALPEGYSLGEFIAAAVSTLDQIIESGLADVDTQFLDRGLTPFLQRLAKASRMAPPQRRPGRQRVPLA
jgi:hypothetical protein